MSDIFISYRRGTASPYARGIYERLERQFGPDRVFMDIDTMEPGVDFVEYIQTAVSSCQVLIVVIGPDWVATADDTGRRRLDDPEDFVRVEVTAAFERDDVRVIPVLVGDAAPPKKAELPPELAPLTRRQALEITDGRWDYDLSVLVRTIRRVFADPEPARQATDLTPPEGASDRVERASAVAEHRPTDGAEANPPKANWFRRHVGVTITVAILAAAGVAAILVASGGGEESQKSAAIPEANPCQRMKKGWMVTDLEAEEHHECKLTTSPPPNDLELPSLVYGLFSSATKARKEFDEGLRFEYDNGATNCPQRSLRRMRDVLGQGDFACFVDGDDEYIAMWWNVDRSAVLGVLDFAASTEPKTAVEAWVRVLLSN